MGENKSLIPSISMHIANGDDVGKYMPTYQEYHSKTSQNNGKLQKLNTIVFLIYQTFLPILDTSFIRKVHTFRFIETVVRHFCYHVAKSSITSPTIFRVFF